MAAITAMLAVSIKISAKSKPANARPFDMGTSLKYPDTNAREPDKRGEIVIAEPRSPHWPAPGSADTELGVLMEPEVCHGETEVYTGVQA